MTALKKTSKLVQITAVDALLPDGSRIAWQSFRDASAPATDKPSVYFTTLAANADDTGSTTLSLATIGAQAVGHVVDLMLTAGTARLTYADGSTQELRLNESVPLPARGTAAAIKLTFTGDTCSMKAYPQWKPTASAKSLTVGSETTLMGTTEDNAEGYNDGGVNPPPPFPGQENEN